MRVPRHLIGFAIVAAVASCKPPVTVRRTVAPSGGDAFIIGCEDTPIHCKEQARELCPFGETTLNPGVGGWYAEGEDFRHSQRPRNEQRNYKLEDWVIRCNLPPTR
jgi:hypothetical protein